jgi:phosphohistidine phosphatase SixA
MKTTLGLKFDRIFVSPLTRTLMTAEQIAHHHGMI